MYVLHLINGGRMEKVGLNITLKEFKQLRSKRILTQYRLTYIKFNYSPKNIIGILFSAQYSLINTGTSFIVLGLPSPFLPQKNPA